MKDFKFTLAAIKVKGKDILFLIAVEVITTSKRHQRTEKKTLYNVDERG
jgi:small neutral amino acid transporter SnatA (MarC family)